MIEPLVGQSVQVWVGWGSEPQRPYAAVVIRVREKGRINALVFNDGERLTGGIYCDLHKKRFETVPFEGLWWDFPVSQRNYPKPDRRRTDLDQKRTADRKRTGPLSIDENRPPRAGGCEFCGADNDMMHAAGCKNAALA